MSSTPMTEAPARTTESRCPCGWELPLSVMPVPVDDYVGSDREIDEMVIATACVVLKCPNCERGHAFFHPAAYIAATAGSKGSG